MWRTEAWCCCECAAYVHDVLRARWKLWVVLKRVASRIDGSPGDLHTMLMHHDQGSACLSVLASARRFAKPSSCVVVVVKQ